MYFRVDPQESKKLQSTEPFTAKRRGEAWIQCGRFRAEVHQQQAFQTQALLLPCRGVIASLE